jgi:hypothetical protein
MYAYIHTQPPTYVSNIMNIHSTEPLNNNQSVDIDVKHPFADSRATAAADANFSTMKTRYNNYDLKKRENEEHLHEITGNTMKTRNNTYETKVKLPERLHGIIADTIKTTNDEVETSNKEEDETKEDEMKGTHQERFQEITDQELDDLMSNTITPNTRKQTTWAVKLFKGIRYYDYFFM